MFKAILEVLSCLGLFELGLFLGSLTIVGIYWYWVKIKKFQKMLED